MDYEKEIDDYVLIQYIIIYVLASVDKPLSYDVLINIITEKADINYIEFQLALDNLECTDFVCVTDDDGRSVYSVTEKGKTASKLFENDIPVYIREPIRNSITPNIERDRKKRLVRTKIRSVDDSMHYADCSVYDDDDTLLMKLSVFSPTREEAVNIAKRFKENPDSVYAKIISALAD